MNIKRTGSFGSERRGMPHLMVLTLCLVSFGIGYIFGGATEYCMPIDFASQVSPLTSNTGSNGLVTKQSSSTDTIIQDIAKELVEHTLGDEMLKQANEVPPEELKKAFYRALSSTVGSPPKAANNNKPVENKESVEIGQEQSFLSIATAAKTEKVQAYENYRQCLKDQSHSMCMRRGSKQLRCVPRGHFYDTLYQSQLGHLSRSGTTPFQALEIGFFHGAGYKTLKEWLPRAEVHSIEISCLPPGPRSEGKWPYENVAATDTTLYGGLLATKRLHCGDATDLQFVNTTYTTLMKRRNAPPLKLVIEDGSGLASHMATSFFYWFPRIEPGGYMVIEDIQPMDLSNRFRTQFMPQIMSDLHYCGEPRFPDPTPCFPTIQPLLESIYCEMHICVFKRNKNAAKELSRELSVAPPNALDASQCPSLQTQTWERS